MATRRLYRIVETNPPTPWDGKSHRERGRSVADERLQEQVKGLSLYDDDDAAQRRALATPYLGTFIAIVEIPEDAPFIIGQTGRRHHHTLYGPLCQVLE